MRGREEWKERKKKEFAKRHVLRVGFCESKRRKGV
jgi:hypothetical protein